MAGRAVAQIKGKHRQELACDWFGFCFNQYVEGISALCASQRNVIAVWTGIVWEQEFCVKSIRKYLP
jgi:hypothetical protein